MTTFIILNQLSNLNYIKEFWAQLIYNNDTNRTLTIPTSFKSWIKKEITSNEDKWSHFPSRLTYLFAFIRSNYWDHLFLNFFILWLLIVIFVGDGWAAKYSPIPLSLGQGVVLIPIVAMLITQLIPFLGTIYFTHYCNDLVHYSAQVNMLHWVRFSSLIINK